MKCAALMGRIRVTVGRTPHGVRGLKFFRESIPMTPPGRTPHGVRGLKWWSGCAGNQSAASHPARGAWIEMLSLLKQIMGQMSHPARGAWIEIHIAKVRRKVE